MCTDILLIYFLVASCCQVSGQEEPDSLRLMTKLLNQSLYNRHLPPRRTAEDPIRINLRMNLYQILDVNEAEHNIVIYMWMEQHWKDEFLVWDPKDYAGIDQLVLPVDQVWLPDTYLYNSLVMEQKAVERWINVKVSMNCRYANSTIQFQYPAIYSASCKMNIRYFPFDRQNCSLIFASWTHDASSVDYFSDAQQVRNESFITNGEWNVVSFKIERVSKKYSCCPHPYTELHAHLVIQRKPLYYVFNLVIPTVIITIIAVLGFFMPNASDGSRSEKVNLGITTLLAMAILLLMVSDQMPKTSELVPLIGWFFLAIIVVIAAGTFASSFVITVQKKGRHGSPLPKSLKICFCKGLACLLRLTPPDHLAPKIKQSNSNNETQNQNGHTLKKQLSKFDAEPLLNEIKSDQNSGVTSFSRVGFVFLHDSVARVESQMHELINIVKEKETAENNQKEWEFLADILDRVFLIFFLSICIGIFLTFLLIGSASVPEDGFFASYLLG